ncbi:annexin VII [Thermus scotoductus]|nr:annexin VII [Thermus scotoductus]
MGRAALALGITQPAVSQYLRALEDHVGHPLFERRGFYALYYFFGLWGRRAPEPEEVPDWVEGPRPTPDSFLPPYDQVQWLERHGYTLFVNESK